MLLLSFSNHGIIIRSSARGTACCHYWFFSETLSNCSHLAKQQRRTPNRSTDLPRFDNMGGREEQFATTWLSRRQAAQIYLLLLLLLSFYRPSSSASAAAAAGARPGSHWTTPVILGNDEGVFNSLLLAGGGPGPAFAFGFLKRPKEGFLLAVFLVRTDNFSSIVSTTAELVWTANRKSPVFGFAALDLTTGGDLRLSDGRGDLVWSTNTSGKGVASMSLTMGGNLKLIDAKGQVVWQSYDHPTDTAVRNQSLTGLTLVSNSSATNLSEGAYYLSVTNSSFEAYVLGDPGSPAQMYYTLDTYPDMKLTDGILFPLDLKPGRRLVQLPTSNRTHNGTNRTDLVDYSDLAKGFVRLEADGRLQKYVWQEALSAWQPQGSLLDDDRGDCGYPKVCSRYGICSEGECSCPQADYFEPVEERKLKQGCKPLTDLRDYCPAQAAGPHQMMVAYQNISYFGYVRKADMEMVTPEHCEQACAVNCSCKAAFFKYGFNNSIGDCYLVSTIFSIIENHSRYNSFAYIKVQLGKKKSRHLAVPLSLGLIGLLTLAGACFGYILYRKKNLIGKEKKLEEEDAELFQFEHLPGMPTRFTYAELKEATDGFAKKLGEGGFGAVFKGTLKDGTQVAVKILGYKGQGMKEFLAEVETIGSIHHLNLVRLVGYCAERLHRLLVYEFLSNGSLENWIFHDKEKSDDKPLLNLDTKMKIVLQVAKALSYLHEECRHRIIHLDIKPQNILLDDNFHAKVSDFGLSKLVERDQSQVVTTMRGTPGYLAPEWLNSLITEKVDVYSFGVVVLETVSGKKILDYSRSQESINLLHLLSKAAVEERLADIVGADSDDEGAIRLVKIAMWCLQMDYTKRPSMSAVVKALEGVTEVELAVNFWVHPAGATIPSDAGSTSKSITLLPSILAEPR